MPSSVDVEAAEAVAVVVVVLMVVLLVVLLVVMLRVVMFVRLSTADRPADAPPDNAGSAVFTGTEKTGLRRRQGLRGGGAEEGLCCPSSIITVSADIVVSPTDRPTRMGDVQKA